MSRIRRCLLLAVVASLPAPAALAQKEFGFDNTRASGQPYLTPEESVQRLKVPPGWEVKVFAAEPDIINPISFTVDEKGRLWVVECYEYPKRTANGQKPRDRIKVLEDTDGDGKADKVTVWAEGKDFPPGDHARHNGFDMASGIEVGHGGVFLGAAPYLFFLRDTKGAGHCDSIEVLLRGFGSEDTHEVLNTMQWGPDGLLYGLHGIFTNSKVGDVQMNAAVWRYDARSRQFGIFAEGTSNPWGLDFDQHGQAFLACCVIPHCFHMIPGGTYIRQAGGSFNPYAYGLLKEISDHTHHKESGWAHAGVLAMQGDDIPEEYRDSLLMGSIHGCSIKRDVLDRNGSTFVAHHGPDFLVSEDKNFRPINLRWAPDGSIYLIDWHDQNPCHQAAPDSWDMTHGRIYKIQRKGAPHGPAPDLGKKTSAELVELLKNNNPWWHRTALRLLAERRDRGVVPALQKLALESATDTLSLRGLWGLYAVGAFDEDLAAKALEHQSPWVRSWSVRLLGEGGAVSEKVLAKFADMAAKDPAPEVRSQLASTAQRLTKQDTLPLLHNLMKHPEDAKDPCLPLMIWLAYEPRVPKERAATLGWLKGHAGGNSLVTDAIVPRAMRRLMATGKAEDRAACIVFLGELADGAARRRALEGLTLALQGQQVDGPAEWKGVLAKLIEDSDAEVQRLARKLAVNFRDPEAIRRALATARDAGKPTAARLDAVRDLALAHPPEAEKPLEEIVTGEGSTELRCEACRALAGYADASVPQTVLAGWKNYPPPVRTEAVNLLASRKDWARDLLDAVGKKDVPRSDLTNSTILRIRALRDKKLDAQIEAVWGRIRDTPAELNALIEKMRGELHTARGSFERGRKIFENTCVKCHKFEGRGVEVGPELDGAARDIEYLLVNVLDPNRVVGAPYVEKFVALKSGQVERGLLAAEDEQSITLKTENAATKVILKKNIDEISDQGKSLMPEGLSGTMTVQDFRDLVRYVMAHPFLTDVAVAGPFPAAETGRIDPISPLTSNGVTWSNPVVGVPGRIPLPAAKDHEVVVFITAEVMAPTTHRTKLQLGAGQPVQVWLNGQPVHKSKPGESAAPDQVSVEVELREGSNRLLFQVTYKGDKEALYARLLDPQRKLRYTEVKEK
jgi:putative membrane-bound dehydrogenase-like protein